MYSKIKKDFADNKQFVLFLGAGVNLCESYGMSWNKLMSELFESILYTCAYENDFSGEEIDQIKKYAEDIDQIKKYAEGKGDKSDIGTINFLKSRDYFKSTFPPLVQCTVIKHELGNGYIPLIQHKIYKDCPKGKLEELFRLSYKKELEPNNGPFFTLYCLAKLILLCDNIKAVVTQNYDNFLSRAVNELLHNQELYFNDRQRDIISKKKGFTIRDISGMGSEQSLNSGVFPVYHVHGYISDYSEIIPEERSGGIVLSMDEIYETTRDVFSWQTSTQMHFLSNYACILAGFSFTDVTSQRLLYYVGKSGHKENLYYLDAFKSRAGNEENINAEKAFMKIRNSFLRRYGLSLIYSWEDFGSLYNNLVVSVLESLAIN